MAFFFVEMFLTDVSLGIIIRIAQMLILTLSRHGLPTPLYDAKDLAVAE